VEKAEAGRFNLCELLEWETLFSVLYGVYTLAFAELKKVLKTAKRRRTRQPSQEHLPNRQKASRSKRENGEALQRGTGRRQPRNRVQVSNNKHG
jgi:hypothetical protein